MKLVSRRGWSARAPKSRTPLARSAQKGTAVHYSASDADEQNQHMNCAGRVRSIQRFHMDTRGWADIAYSYLVCKHGSVFEGRGLGIRTAANGTTVGNDGYHAVCFLGDDTAGRDDVTDAGRRAIFDAVAMCNGWSQTADTVVPHSHFKATACPGNDLRAWIARGMSLGEDDVSQADVIAALKSKEGQAALELAIDHLMSQGLTGDRSGAIRGWAVRLEKTDANVRKILEHLGIPAGE